VTVTVAVPVQPAPELPVTEYVVVAAGETVNEEPLPDGLQEYVVPPVAEMVVLFPAHTEAGDAEAEIVALVLTVIVMVAVPVQLALDPVTVYVVVEAGETVIEAVDAPVLHEYVVAPLAVRVALPPVQRLVAVADTETEGETFTVIVCVLSVIQDELPTV